MPGPPPPGDDVPRTVATRVSTIREGQGFEFVSREGALVANNLLLSVILGVVLIGTLGAQQPEPGAYTLGAASASTLWFLTLALGGAWLAPWLARPLTWRLIDLGDADKALGGIPVGQSGVPFDAHYGDQAAAHVAGEYQPQHLSEADVKANSQGTLRLLPR